MPITLHDLLTFARTICASDLPTLHEKYIFAKNIYQRYCLAAGGKLCEFPAGDRTLAGVCMARGAHACWEGEEISRTQSFGLEQAGFCEALSIAALLIAQQLHKREAETD